MSFSVNETNSNISVTEATTELVVEDRAARVTVSADEMSVEITSPGPQGPVGPGVPLGGVTNDVLVKLSGTQYDTGWRDEITVDQLFFDTGAAEAAAVGAFSWNTEEGTVELGLVGGNVTLNLGSTIVVRAYNDETTAVSKGQVVRVSGAQGQRLAFLKASNLGLTSDFRTIGLAAESIAGKSEGWVIVRGVLRGLQTPSFSEGDLLFVGSTAGTLTNVRPSYPASAVQVGYCLVQSQGQGQNGEIYIDVFHGDHLEFLHDVKFTNLTSGQVLYNSTTGAWVNKALVVGDVSGAVPTTRTVSASTGLSGGGDLSADRSFAVLYGTTAGTAAQGNDARLSDARTPLAHASTHHTGGSDPLTATNIGAVPQGRQVASGTGLAGGGDLSADRTLSVLYGTTAGTAAQGNDARLSDARTPTAHASSHFTGGSDPIAATNIGAVPEGRQVIAGTGLSGGGTLAADRTLAVLYGTTAGTAAQGNDARLSDARTPTAHASSHFTGGSDPIAATNIGAVPEGRQIIAGTALTGGGTLAADRTLNVLIGTTSGAVASGDRGLPTGGTASQVLVKNSGTNYDTSWSDVKLAGQGAQPRIHNALYISESGLECYGSASQFASSPDSVALSITGDMEIEVKFTPSVSEGQSQWRPALEKGNVDYILYLFRPSANGMRFDRFDSGGTFRSYAATNSTGFTAGTTYWVKLEFDVDNGSSQSEAKFYTSTNGSTFTLLQSVTVASTLGTRDSTGTLRIGSPLGGSGAFAGTIHRITIRNGIGGTVAYDANFENATTDAISFTESSSNGALVSVTTNRYRFGIPNMSQSAISNTSLSANTAVYTPFFVSHPISVDMFVNDVVSGPASTAELRHGIYAADAELQPTGAPLADSGAISVAASTAGVGLYQTTITPVTLTPGAYLLVTKTSVTIPSYRTIFGGQAFGGWGSNAADHTYSVAQNAGAFPSTPDKWTTVNAGQTGTQRYASFRYKPA